MLNENLKDELTKKSLEERLDIIEKMGHSDKFTDDDFEILEYLSQDGKEEVRARVAEILVLSDSHEGEKILIKLLTDKDELVRVNACDSLCNSTSLEVINLLKERILKDKSILVKGYAALSIADIVSNTGYDKNELSKFLKDALEKQKVVWVKINFYKVLYMLGEESYLDKLLNELQNKLYRNRCAVVNVLSEIVSERNLGIIKTALIGRLEKEKTIAVRSSIEKAIQSIDELNIAAN